MKASAGSAMKGSGAPASRAAASASRRPAVAPAKPARPTTVKQPTASAKAARPAPAVVKRPPPAAAKATPVAKVTEKHPVAAKAASVKPAEIRPKAAPRPTAGKPVEARPAAQPAQLSEPVAPPPEAPASAPAAATPSPATPPSPAPAAAGPAPAPAPGPGRPMMPDRIPPRPPAKAEIFVEGDHVVYPTHGVGKVERIATEEIAGHKLELIHITFEENRMTLRVPVAKARTAGLRKLATRKLFDEALAVLKGRARIKRTMWSRRAQEYEAKINSGDPLAIAEVVRDLHRNSGQPDQSFSERQIYEAAMDRLAAELAALDKTDKLTAATKLTNFLKTV
jgi:CarD family transcriptional regulator